MRTRPWYSVFTLCMDIHSKDRIAIAERILVRFPGRGVRGKTIRHENCHHLICASCRDCNDRGWLSLGDFLPLKPSMQSWRMNNGDNVGNEIMIMWCRRHCHPQQPKLAICHIGAKPDLTFLPISLQLRRFLASAVCNPTSLASE